jgi:hypothetical protein
MFLSWRKKTKISEIKEGQDAVVQGRVVAVREISATGSGTKCVYFSAMLELFTTGTRGRGRKMWIPQSAEERCSGFFVDDGSAKIWVTEQANALQVQGGAEETGSIGKKGNQRFFVRTIRSGDTVRIRGIASKPKGSEPAKTFVLRPGKKGRLEVLVRK